MRYILSLVAIMTVMLFSHCNKKCRNLASDVSGGIVKAYDFGNCFLYTSLDSQVVVDNSSKWSAFKQKYLKYCDTNSLESIDFSKHMLVGYKLKVYACNVGFHRKLIVDDAAKTYTYLIQIEQCKGCNSELASPNWVLMPQLPAGYTLKFKSENL